MSLFSKSRRQKSQDNLQILKAREYLEDIHPANHFFYGHEPYHYLQTSKIGNYVRYYFYKGHDKRLLYIVLSYEEICKLEKELKERKGQMYVYQDTILNTLDDNGILHRFHIPNVESSTLYMTDDGEIKNVVFAKPD